MHKYYRLKENYYFQVMKFCNRILWFENWPQNVTPLGTIFAVSLYYNFWNFILTVKLDCHYKVFLSFKILSFLHHCINLIFFLFLLFYNQISIYYNFYSNFQIILIALTLGCEWCMKKNWNPPVEDINRNFQGGG